MWKLGRSRVLLDEAPEEDDAPRAECPAAGGAAGAAAAAAQIHKPQSWKRRLFNLDVDSGDKPEHLVRFHPGQLFLRETGPGGQGAGFRGWKEVSSLFNKDDEQHLLERCKSPKSKVANLRLKEELKAEKKPGFWDNLVLKQSSQPKKPDEIEGWEPPKLSLEDVAMDVGDTVSDCAPRLDWEEDGKASNKYTSLAGSGSSSRWGLRSAGKLVGIRRPSRGHLTDSWEGLE